VRNVHIPAIAVIVWLVFAVPLFAQGTGPEETTSLSQKERCPVCGMFVSMFADWNATIEFKDSTHATFDGSKDLFKYYLNMRKYNPSKSKSDATAITVKDYYSRASIDALPAYYVIWSDVYGPMGHEPIPFEKEADAKRFMKEHKGKKVLRFKDVNSKLITSLDNP
jgi:nitrous oxide reductase accessory protein NosL